MSNIRILTGRVDNVTFSNIIENVKELLKDPSPHQIVTANTLMMLALEQDAELVRILEKASLVVPESWGIFWASRRQNTPLPSFIPGIDLMDALCKLAAEQGHSIYLLGAQPGVAEQAAQALQIRHPHLNVAGTHHGYFTREEEPIVLAEIRMAAPTFLFVGMNVPGQEKWIARNLQALQVPIVMGVGGSFDVFSGRLRRAPRWMRQLGLEWVFRTLQEPWRLKRIKDLPVFMWKVIKQK